MPIYDYECTECKSQFEVEAKMSDPPPGACPQCAAPTPRRMISRTSFVLKGGGWYVTDYKSKRKDPPGKTDAPETSPDVSAAAKPKEGASSPIEPPAAKKDGDAKNSPTPATAAASDNSSSAKTESKPKTPEK